MPKHSHYLLFLLITAGAAYSVKATDAPTHWMTGEHLLKRLEPVDPATVPWRPDSKWSREELAEQQAVVNTEFVRGFVAALHDATEGRSWCFNHAYKVPKPDTFWEESRWGLARLAPAQLKGNAADLLVDIWRQKWPCQPKSQRR